MNLSIVDQCTYLGVVEISKGCSWDTRIAKGKEEGKSHVLVGKMDATLTDSHLDARIKM